MIDLEKLGFTYTGSCNCNGSFNRKYKWNEWTIYLTKSKFKVKRNGATVKGYTDITGLEAYLQAALPQLFTGTEIQNNPGV